MKSCGGGGWGGLFEGLKLGRNLHLGVGRGVRTWGWWRRESRDGSELGDERLRT